MWGNRRRSRGARGTGKKAQKDFAAEAVEKYSTSIMYNRWKLLCPFEVDLDLIYNALFTQEQHRAASLLMRTAPSMVMTGKVVNISYDMPTSVTVRGATPVPHWFCVTFPREMPLPDSRVTHGSAEHLFLLSQLPAPLREPIAEWGSRWLTASRETRETCGKLEELFDKCSTMGQIKRVWPNACNLLPEAARAALREAKVRSPYPESVLDIHYRDDGKKIAALNDEWKPEVLEWFDTRLTEALCLPMVDGTTDFDIEIEYGF